MVLGGLAIGVGCSDASSAGFPDDLGPENLAAPKDDTTFGGTDASASPGSAVRGSPLCAVTESTCNPDDDGSKSSTCVGMVPDAGVNDLDASAAAACRIDRQGDAGFAPTCLASQANWRGTDGVACEQSADCAPGYDCVDGDKGGVCRRYCCSGSCATHTSQNGGPTFCDIQKLFDFNTHNAPVCMPLKKCKLLKVGECVDKETCAVVNERGETGCVPKGPALAGDSCDEEHCAENLTCLGTPGDRRCYQLCRTDGTECGPTKKCTTGSVFQDTTFGVCKDVSP